METSLIDILRTLFAVAVGGAIGYAFGLVQNAALRRNEQRQFAGKLKNGWSLMPGSGMRIAYLLVSLALVQLVCPILFADGTQWWVSAGLVLGYGWTLYRQLRLRLKAATN